MRNRVGTLLLLGACSYAPQRLSPGDDAVPIDTTTLTDAPVDMAVVCAGVVCDDNDPCTVDSCVADQCQFAAVALPAGCSGPLHTCAASPASCYAQCTAPTAWPTAETTCVAWGGHLVTLTTTAETTCIGTFLPATSRAWIGYFQPPGTNEPLAGWVWISGDPDTHAPDWISGQPNQSGEQDCAFAEGPNGQWYDHECTAVEHGFICEK